MQQQQEGGIFDGYVPNVGLHTDLVLMDDVYRGMCPYCSGMIEVEKINSIVEYSDILLATTSNIGIRSGASKHSKNILIWDAPYHIES